MPTYDCGLGNFANSARYMFFIYRCKDHTVKFVTFQLIFQLSKIYYNLSFSLRNKSKQLRVPNPTISWEIASPTLDAMPPLFCLTTVTFQVRSKIDRFIVFERYHAYVRMPSNDLRKERAAEKNTTWLRKNMANVEEGVLHE